MTFKCAKHIVRYPRQKSMPFKSIATSSLLISRAAASSSGQGKRSYSSRFNHRQKPFRSQ
jgi:hypothetical protein